MKCPKCNVKLEKGICLKCGYMENGEQIERFKKKDKYTDIRIYNDEFETMNHNENKIINLLLGPLYFSYRNHLITGTIISILSYIIFTFEMKLTESFLEIGTLCTLLAVINITIYIVINRVLYMTFSNAICIELDKIKIKMIKKHNKNYINKLVEHKSKTLLTLLIQILFYIIIGIFILKTGKC